MKRRDFVILGATAFVTAIFTVVLSNVAFGGFHKSQQLKSADVISTGFPDIKNDPNYNNFLNRNALDPAQPVKPGVNNNSQPFNGASQ
jgi:hypothetical protein